MYNLFVTTAFIFGGILLAVEFCRELMRGKPTVNNHRDVHPTDEQNLANIQRVIESHTDFTAEVFDIIIDGSHCHISKQLNIGDAVTLQSSKDEVFPINVFMQMKWVGRILSKDGSRLPDLLKKGHHIEAYIGGRDVNCYREMRDAVTIIAFYKLDGVSPTRVNLKLNDIE